MKQIRLITAIVLLLACGVAAAGVLSNLKDRLLGTQAPKTSVADLQTTTSAPAGELAWNTDLKTSIDRAKAAGKPVVVDFFATWCGPCKLMDKTTWSDPAVKQRFLNVELVRIDVDQQPDVARQYGVTGMPTVMCLNGNGEVQHREMGYLTASALLSKAEKCLGGK